MQVRTTSMDRLALLALSRQLTGSTPLDLTLRVDALVSIKPIGLMKAIVATAEEVHGGMQLKSYANAQTENTTANIDALSVISKIMGL